MVVVGDRLLPERLANVNERTHSPVPAILTVMVLVTLMFFVVGGDTVSALKHAGVAERVELNVGGNPHNAGYLDTKARRMGHLISTPMNLHGLFNKEQS